jgi:hypothetical protein
LAWLFVLRGSTRGSLFQVFVGWGFAALVAIYKAQFFVTIALVSLAVPPLFLRGRLRASRRAAWLLATLGGFVAAVRASQEIPTIPLIRLDGSSTGRLLDLVMSYAAPESIGNVLVGLVGVNRPWVPNLVLGAPYLLIAIFGLILPGLVGLLLYLRRRVSPLLVLFPLFVTANFLLMALGLKLDERHVGTPEELQHRPFLLLYFALVAWAGGAAAFALLQSRWRRHGKALILGAVTVLTVVPAAAGPGLQNLSTMRDESKVRIPTAMLRAAEYMRDHGDARDVFQASSLDPNYVVAALADRQPYFDRQLYWARPSEQSIAIERTYHVAELMQMQDPGQVIMTAARLGIRWFLVFPEHGVMWPPSLQAQPAFSAGGFRLFRLD